MLTQLKSKFTSTLPPVLLILLTIFIYGPTAVYSGNTGEFMFPLASLLRLYVIPFLILFLLLITISLLIPKKVLRVYVSVLFAIGLLLWVQGSFMVWDYGLFDGNLINWSNFIWQGWTDILVWVVFLTLAVLFSKRIIVYSSLLIWLLISLQSIIFIFTLIQTDRDFKDNYQVPRMNVPTELYNYSKTFNILHFMMDHFQTDVFLEIVEENSMENQLVGFTAFRENLSSATSTSLCIPAIFSGELYDGKNTIGENFIKSIKDKGFQNILFKEGFKLNFIPSISMPHLNVANYYMIPQAYGGSIREETILKAIHLINIAVFRISPQFIKKLIYNENNWSFYAMFSKSPNIGIISVFNFLKDYIHNVKVTDIEPTYHYIFINPPHPPYVLNNKGNYAGKVLEPTRENYKVQATHTLKLFIELIKQLKILGLYDDALIILQSDHGSLITPVRNGSNSSVKMKRAPAMLAVKPPHASGIMKISDAQSMNSDIPATIMDILNLDYNYNGIPLFKINPNENRRRNFITSKSKYLVNGSLYLKESWSKIEEFDIKKPLPVYCWDSTIQFGVFGNAEKYQGAGWSVPLENCEWNNGNKCILNFLVEEIQTDVILKAKFLPYLAHGKLKKQTVIISANGYKLGKWILTAEGTQTQSIIIPNEFITGKELIVEFEFPNATSPKSLNLSPDGRQLAIAMVSLIMEQKK